jgi:hypothetical protein
MGVADDLHPGADDAVLARSMATTGRQSRSTDASNPRDNADGPSFEVVPSA